ncbi:hypothetical protein BD410DRAFT_700522, partial [Rickenella mellea]
VPQWNGNPETLGNWIIKLQTLAHRNESCFKALGRIVPERLTKDAERWYWSQSYNVRERAEKDWYSIRDHIMGYFMNSHWLSKQKAKAIRARYRDKENPNETPSQYYIRKYELITLVYDLTDAEIIMEVMEGAPSYWMTILTTQSYDTLEQFQKAIRYHEDILIAIDPRRP